MEAIVALRLPVEVQRPQRVTGQQGRLTQAFEVPYRQVSESLEGGQARDDGRGAADRGHRGHGVQQPWIIRSLRHRVEKGETRVPRVRCRACSRLP